MKLRLTRLSLINKSSRVLFMVIFPASTRLVSSIENFLHEQEQEYDMSSCVSHVVFVVKKDWITIRNKQWQSWMLMQFQARGTEESLLQIWFKVTLNDDSDTNRVFQTQNITIYKLQLHCHSQTTGMHELEDNFKAYQEYSWMKFSFSTEQKEEITQLKQTVWQLKIKYVTQETRSVTLYL